MRNSEQAFLAVASLVLLGIAAILMTPPWRSFVVFASVGLSVLAVWGLARPGPGAALALLATAICSVAMTGLAWQAVMPLAVLVLIGVTKLRPQVGSVRQPLGRVPFWGTLGCAAVTPVALTLWLRLSGSDVSDLVSLVPNVGLPLLVLGGAAFAVVNAAFEELIWRGIFHDRLTELFGVSPAIAIQAASFGVAHAHGVPRGFAGVALAGIWGGMLGVLRARTRGLLAPVLAHIVADATIAYLIVSLAR